MIKRRQKVNNNAGFTLVELIIVIAVMAVTAGISIIGFGLLASGDSKKAVKNVSSQLTELRNNTLSIAGTWRGELYMKDGTYYIDIINYKGTKDPTTGAKVYSDIVMSSAAIGNRINVLYEYYDAADSLQTEDIDDNSKLTFTFEQGSGKVLAVKVTDISSGSVTTLSGSGAKGNIKVVNKSGSKTNLLTLWYLSGKVTADY